MLTNDTLKQKKTGLNGKGPIQRTGFIKQTGFQVSTKKSSLTSNQGQL